jgi:hypothetical protein
LHKFYKERRRSPRGCFITDCPKNKNLDSSSNKYDYIKRNDYNKGNDNKYHFGVKKKMKF